MLSDKINEVRKNKKMTLEMLSANSGVPISTIKKISAGITTNPSLDTVKAIAYALDCSLEEFSESNTASLTTHEQTHITKYRACTTVSKKKVDRVLDYEHYVSTAKIVKLPSINNKVVPLPNYIQAATAGSGNFLDDDYYEIINFPAASVPYGADYTLNISGDSMEPDIPDGSIVFVRSCPCVDSGDIGVFLLNGDSFCKKFIYDRENQLIQLISLNSEHDPIDIEIEDDLVVLGKVLGVYEED